VVASPQFIAPVLESSNHFWMPVTSPNPNWRAISKPPLKDFSGKFCFANNSLLLAFSYEFLVVQIISTRKENDWKSYVCTGDFESRFLETSVVNKYFNFTCFEQTWLKWNVVPEISIQFPKYRIFIQWHMLQTISNCMAGVYYHGWYVGTFACRLNVLFLPKHSYINSAMFFRTFLDLNSWWKWVIWPLIFILSLIHLIKVIGCVFQPYIFHRESVLNHWFTNCHVFLRFIFQLSVYKLTKSGVVDQKFAINLPEDLNRFRYFKCATPEQF